MTPDAGPALAPGDFEPHVGTSFAVETPWGTQPLTLTGVQLLPQSPRAGGGFRLEFSGPYEPVLPQAIYGFPLGTASHDIFIVPIGRNDASVRYEAVFF